MKLQKKIWKISEREPSRNSFKSAQGSRNGSREERRVRHTKSPSTSMNKHMTVSDLHMGIMSRNKSMHFDQKREYR